MYYIFTPNFNDDFISSTDENYHYLGRVLRIKHGEKIVLFDGSGVGVCYNIEKIEKKGIYLNKLYEISERNTVDIHLFIGMPKPEKMELIIDQTTQLGVTHIHPVITHRSKKLSEEKNLQKRITRWKKIGIEASRQSRRLIIPVIDNPIKFEESIAAIEENSLKIGVWERSDILIKNGLKLLNNIHLFKTINLFVGPEGSFTDYEISLLKDNNFSIWSLGKNILRVETAALVLLSLVKYEVNLFSLILLFFYLILP